MIQRFTLRGFCIAGAALVLLAVIWAGGPFVAIAGWYPLQGIAARGLFITLLLLVFTACKLWQLRRERRANTQLVNDILVNTHSDDAQLQADIATLRDTMKKAMDMVGRWKPGRFKSGYDLPWYMIIGAPGSGKSTTLSNSGLEFPLREAMGVDAIKGVGGTRNCDWWFTNRAVIIDTAGRYTLQESADKSDTRSWNTFLGLLKKHRPRRPINGVIITISIADLLQQTPTERQLHAKAIKQRVQELRNKLAIIFPVYVVLTKFDLVAGFRDMFGTLPDTERENSFGFTFDVHTVRQPQQLSDNFSSEFVAMQTRIHSYLLYRLQHTANPQAQRLLYQFPKQMELLQAPLWDMVREIFYPSAYEDTPLLRGLYFVSAEQQGSSIDRISGALDQHLQLTPQPRPAAELQPRSYFSKTLFDNIIFAEANLVTADSRHAHKRSLLQLLGYSGVTLASVLVAAIWVYSYDWQHRQLAQIQQILDQSDSGSDTHPDWRHLHQQLQTYRDLLTTPAADSAAPALHLGIDHRRYLQESSTAAYRRLLQRDFASALRQTLETDIHSGNQSAQPSSDLLYESLKTYLMLSDTRHRRPDDMQGWFAWRMEQALPGESRATLRADLEAHLQAYLEQDFSIAANPELVARARQQLTRLPLAERIYARLKLNADAAQLPPFRLPMILGTMASTLFENRSGRSLEQGIAGFYTANGYNNLFLPEQAQTIQYLLDDAWIYGSDSGEYKNLDASTLTAQVADLYFADYIAHWEGFLSDLRIHPYSNLQTAASISALLASPTQPLPKLIAAIQQNTRLDNSADSARIDAVKEAVVAKATQRKRQLGQLLASTDTFNDSASTTPVDQHFAALNSITPELLNQIHQHLKVTARYFAQQADPVSASLVTAPDRAQHDQAVNDIFSGIRDTGAEHIAAMVTGFLKNNQRSVTKSQHTTLNNLWKTAVYDPYHQSLRERYPFNPDATAEVTLEDFAVLLGYGGALDNFFNTHLHDKIDTSQSPWRFSGHPGLQADSLQFFEQVHRIRHAFFSPGAATPQLEFSLKPYQLDQRISVFTLDIDGQQLTYRHGPTRSSRFSWPQPGHRQMTRLVFTPANNSAPATRTYDGSWSLFRMLDTATKTADNNRIALSADSYAAELELTGSAIKHPQAIHLLHNFTLPKRL